MLVLLPSRSQFLSAMDLTVLSYGLYVVTSTILSSCWVILLVFVVGASNWCLSNLLALIAAA